MAITLRPASAGATPDPRLAALASSDGLPEGLVSQGRLGVDVLIGMRWVLLAAELAIVLGAEFGRGLRLPLAACLAAIAIGAAYNLFLVLTRPAARRPWTMNWPGNSASTFSNCPP